MKGADYDSAAAPKGGKDASSFKTPPAFIKYQFRLVTT
jgi:hypothetical protein